MNKAQNILENLKRHQFWILCGLVTVVGLVSWWLATSSLADTYTKNKQKVDSEANKIVSVVGITEHPNKDWNERLGEVVEKDRKVVERAWNRLYSEQKSKVYVWPDLLGQDFVDYVQNLRPGEELPPEMLNRYWNEVLRQFAELAKLVDAEYLDPTKTSVGLERSAPIPTGPSVAESMHKVVWNGQVELQQPYVWEQRPNTQQVLYAQEDIWVMRAICEAIARANEESTGAHDAAVRTIEELAVGYLAAEEFPNGTKEPGRVTRLKAPVVAAGGYGALEGSSGGGEAAASGEGGAATAAPGGGGLQRPPRPDMAVSGGRGGYGALTGESAAPETSTNPDDYLKEWRYVNGSSTPLRAAELASPPFYEYRLMPWKVRMTVDRAKWDELLVMFRNTDLPLAIRQIRVNPTDGASGLGGGGGRDTGRAGGGGYGAVKTGGRESRGGYGGVGRDARRGYGAEGGRGASPFANGMQDSEQNITLELRGVAYLINPPDSSKIGVAGSSSAVADTSAAAAAPAAPATPAAPSGDDPFGAPAPAAAAAPPTRPGAGYGSGR